MKIQKVLLLVVASVLITAGAMAVAYFAVQQTEDEDGKEAVAAASSGGSTSLSVTQPGANRQGLGQNQGLVNGITDGGNSSGSSSSIPGPEGFAEYEQYAEETSALIAEILVGDGAEAKPGDNLVVVYQGWLTDGTLFDQSRTNSDGQIEAFTFQLGAGQVIRGWEEGVTGMKVGGKRRIVVPSVAGYGETGQGSIPPNSMLVFDVELVRIQPANPESGL